MPISGKGSLAEPRERSFPVVNEFRSGVYQIDKSRVFIPLDEAQRMLRLDEGTLYDMEAPPNADGSQPVLGTSPARVHRVLVRAKPGVGPDLLRMAVEGAYERFHARMAADATRVVG